MLNVEICLLFKIFYCLKILMLLKNIKRLRQCSCEESRLHPKKLLATYFYRSFFRREYL